MSARAIWKGNLVLGEHEVPIMMYSAVEDQAVHFHLLHDKDLTLVEQRIVRKDNGREVPKAEQRKAFPLDENRAVILEPDELNKLEPAADREIRLLRFVPVDAGIARWVMRDKRYLGALTAGDGYLGITTLRRSEQVLAMPEIRPGKSRTPSPAEVKLAEQFVESITGEFDPDSWQNDCRERLKKLNVITDEEFASAAPEKSCDIELKSFVPVEEIPPSFFERPYFLAPGERAGKAYTLLAQTMGKTSKAGIGSFVMRIHEYLVAILADGRILRAEVLRYANELRTPESIGLPKAPSKPKTSLMRALSREIDGLSERALDLDEMDDLEAEALCKFAKRKAKSGKSVIGMEDLEDDDGDSTSGAEVIDLMKLLKKSLGSKVVKEAKAPAARKAAARRGSAKKPDARKPVGKTAGAKKGASKTTAKKAPARSSTSRKTASGKATSERRQ